MPVYAVEDRHWLSGTNIGIHLRGKDSAGKVAPLKQLKDRRHPVSCHGSCHNSGAYWTPFSEHCRARWAPTLISLVRILVKGVHLFTCAYEDVGWMRGEAR